MFRISAALLAAATSTALFATEPGDFIAEAEIHESIPGQGYTTLFNQLRPEDWESTFFEVTAPTENPPRMALTEEGRLRSVGDKGDFGLIALDEKLKNFIVKVHLKMPDAPYQYANSGLFLGFQDPRDLEAENLPPEIRTMATERTPGFIAVWSGYEVQILSGVIPGEPATKTNGSFYDVPEGDEPGTQKRVEYKFDPGQSYEVIVKVIDQKYDVYMKWAGTEDFLLVSTFTNLDEWRGRQGLIGFQSYYSNGSSVKAIAYERISLIRLP